MVTQQFQVRNVDSRSRQLLENTLAAARRGGFVDVWLETSSTLTEAITLYLRYGFQPVPADLHLPRCDQVCLACEFRGFRRHHAPVHE